MCQYLKIKIKKQKKKKRMASWLLLNHLLEEFNLFIFLETMDALFWVFNFFYTNEISFIREGCFIPLKGDTCLLVDWVSDTAQHTKVRNNSLTLLLILRAWIVERSGAAGPKLKHAPVASRIWRPTFALLPLFIPRTAGTPAT